MHSAYFVKEGVGFLIRVSWLNSDLFYVNPDKIECIEEMPNTVLTLESGRKLVVTESAEVVIERIVAYRKRVLEGASLSHLHGDLR